jgi:hypothetical protein
VSLTQDDVAKILRIVDESGYDDIHLEIGDFKLHVQKHRAGFSDSQQPSSQFKGAPGTTQFPRADSAMAPSVRSAVAPQANTRKDEPIPEGWIAAQAGPMQKAVYEVQDGARQVTISVSTAGGDMAANVNRWRQQVQLAALGGPDLEREMRKIKVDGQDATYVEAVGPESAKSRETILGVIVEAHGRQWFLKLKGDAELAAREKPHFEKFVQSIRFRGTN